MTEADADVLRDLIANIRHKPVNDNPVLQIVSEDVVQFFTGNRSAEDAARIIHNKVQTYIWEIK